MIVLRYSKKSHEKFILNDIVSMINFKSPAFLQRLLAKVNHITKLKIMPQTLKIRKIDKTVYVLVRLLQT
jgi:hypothetical protein